MTELASVKTVVVISANTEWRVVRTVFPEPALQTSPLGAWFVTDIGLGRHKEAVIFFEVNKNF